MLQDPTCIRAKRSTSVNQNTKRKKMIKDTDITLNDLEIIGNWAKSCETKEQLNIVDKAFNDYCNRYKFWKYRADEILYNQGVVAGIILSIYQIRFGSVE